MNIYENNDVDVRGLYTALNILEKEKARYKIRDEYRKSMLNELQGIDDVVFIGNYDANNSQEIKLLIHFEEDEPSLGLEDIWIVSYSDGKFKNVFPLQTSKAFHQLFFCINERAITDLCEFGLRNNFNTHPMITSYSKNFNVLLLDKSFDVNFVGKENSVFRIRYDYENGIECHTNVLGLKHIFKKDNEAVEQFLKHIKLSDEDIPDYLKQGKQKIYKK